MIIHNVTQFYDHLTKPSLLGPAIEPVTVDQCKKYMKVFITQDDDLIAELITDARIEVEAASQRSLITQQFELALTRFPASNEPLVLMRAPVQSVQSVSYYTPTSVVDLVTMVSPFVTDSDGNVTGDVPQAEAEYLFVPGSPGRINRLWGWWPVVNQFRSDAVHVVYTAGYGDTAASVPVPAKQAIKMLVHCKYDDRPGITRDQLQMVPRPLDVENVIRKLSYGYYPD